ncbi:hypothetical protein ACQKP0_05250 [Heyndrickxia sp. NPDC080065]|uniref:hypothetical protein n=1 Tax=Heyndrickxia sp. NPDC080065 TaxID=3390568 RepID=UPI003D04229E
MIIYFSFVSAALFLSLGWGLFRIRRFEIYKRPLREGALINLTIHLIGSIWWIRSNQQITYYIVPGLIYYVISFVIIYTLNWLLLSLIKPKKLKK